jgi:hypothetical protein
VCTLNPSPREQVARRPDAWAPPPTRAGRAEPPYPPPQGTPLPQVNYPSRTSLGGNLTSASKSRSEVIVLTQDGRGEYFWLNGASVRGQAAELETLAGDPRAYHHSHA